MAAADAPDRLELGRLIARSTGVINANLSVFLGVAVLFAGIPSVVAALMEYYGGGASSSVSNLVSGLGLVVSQAALTPAAISQLNGRRLSFGQASGKISTFFGPFVGINILSVLGIIAGAVLLVVPGVILLCMWCVAKPVRVVEGEGVRKSLARSAALTKGSRWKIFFYILLFMIALVIISAVVGFVAGVMGGSGLGGPAAEVVVQILSAVILPATSAVLYSELSRIKSGMAPETAAAVFD